MILTVVEYLPGMFKGPVPSQYCWRLVHDGTYVEANFDSEGTTRVASPHVLFCATEVAEIDAEILAKGLQPLPEG